MQIAVEFRDPDGHWLEIYGGLDQIAAAGTVRPQEQWDCAKTLEAAIDRPVPGPASGAAGPVTQGRQDARERQS
jgi:hypothetical protein